MSLPPYSTRPTLRIDLDQLKTNYEALKALTPRAKVAAAVKADAYGLGAVSVGRALYGSGCRIFFVATAGEGKILRDALGPNAAIYVLNGPGPRDKGVLLGAKLKPVINTIGQAQYWADVAKSVNDPPYTAIHIDTGMHRLGMTESEVAMLARDKSLWSALNPEWVMSHLACASTPDSPMNAQQLKRFKALAATLPQTPLSLANSAGLYLGKDYHFQMVRTGISLYGGQATNDHAREVTKPVAKLLAPILQIHSVKAGESVGYDATHKAERDMRIATVGAGYADGLPVSLSNKGHSIIHDQAVPIVGRISMDLTTLDVTDLHLPVQVGGVAVFFGDQLETHAKSANTLNYELLVNLGQRVRRDYWKPGGRKEDKAKPSAKPQNRPRSAGKAKSGSPKRGRNNSGQPQRSPGR